MRKEVAAAIFECLASTVRLDVYRLLVRRGLEGAVAGEMSVALKIAPNNLSFHLKALTSARLVAVQQEGRFQRYTANLPLMVEVLEFLTKECCVDQSKNSGYAMVRVECCGNAPSQKTLRTRRRTKSV